MENMIPLAGKNLYFKNSLALLATIAILWVSKPVLVPLIIALLIAQMLSPLATKLEKYMHSGVAVAISMLLLLLVIAGTFSLIASQLAMLEDNLPEIFARVSATFSRLSNEMGHFFGFSRLAQKKFWADSLGTYLSSGSIAAISALTVTLYAVAEAALIAILVFLMMYYRRYFRLQIKAFGESRGASLVGQSLDRFVVLGQNYVAGVSIVMLVVAVADGIGLMLLGAPLPALFGFLGGLAVLVPYVGFAVITPLSAIVAWMLSGSLGMAGGVVLVFTIVHFVEGNLISPFLIGGRVNLNPLATIVAILVGGTIWGPAGMVLFIPIAGFAKLALDSVTWMKPIAGFLGQVPSGDLTRTKKQKNLCHS